MLHLKITLCTTLIEATDVSGQAKSCEVVLTVICNLGFRKAGATEEKARIAQLYNICNKWIPMRLGAISAGSRFGTVHAQKLKLLGNTFCWQLNNNRPVCV